MSNAAITGAIGLYLAGYVVFLFADYIGYMTNRSLLRRDPFHSLFMAFLYLFWPILMLVGLILRYTGRRTT